MGMIFTSAKDCIIDRKRLKELEAAEKMANKKGSPKKVAALTKQVEELTADVETAENNTRTWAKYVEQLKQQITDLGGTPGEYSGE